MNDDDNDIIIVGDALEHYIRPVCVCVCDDCAWVIAYPLFVDGLRSEMARRGGNSGLARYLRT